LVENRRFEPTPPLFGGEPVGKFGEIFGIRKLESPEAIVWRSLRDPAFSHWYSDRQTDVRTHDSIYCASIASRDKNDRITKLDIEIFHDES